MSYLIGHLVGDFLFQTDWMAAGKKERWSPLLIHTLLYTLTVGILTGWGPAALGIVAATHILVDGSYLVAWINTSVKGCKPVLWLDIVADQTIHAATLFALGAAPKVGGGVGLVLCALLVADALLGLAIYRLLRHAPNATSSGTHRFDKTETFSLQSLRDYLAARKETMRGKSL